jgi:hypothetical protein
MSFIILKDEFFDVFYQTGDYAGTGIKKQSLPKNGYDLIIGILSLTFVLLPSLYYFIAMFLNGSLIFKCSIIGFFVTGKKTQLFTVSVKKFS